MLAVAGASVDAGDVQRVRGVICLLRRDSERVGGQEAQAVHPLAELRQIAQAAAYVLAQAAELIGSEVCAGHTGTLQRRGSCRNGVGGGSVEQETDGRVWLRLNKSAIAERAGFSTNISGACSERFAWRGTSTAGRSEGLLPRALPKLEQGRRIVEQPSAGNVQESERLQQVRPLGQHGAEGGGFELEPRLHQF